MRYITHQFAHLETLERARRWLVQLGFHPDLIEVNTHGTPRITVASDRERLLEAELIINAAEHGDPDGWPCFWEMTRLVQESPGKVAPEILPALHTTRSTAIAWSPVDARGADAAGLSEV